MCMRVCEELSMCEDEEKVIRLEECRCAGMVVFMDKIFFLNDIN